MKLPNGERALIDIAKLRDYSLDPVHKEGKHKARVFAAALGISRSQAEWLRDELLKAAVSRHCEAGRKTDYGQRYVMEFELVYNAKASRLRAVWNVRPGEDFPRLITCYLI